MLPRYLDDRLTFALILFVIIGVVYGVIWVVGKIF